jgi:Zn-dependent protease/CBS domain-containing protein
VRWSFRVGTVAGIGVRIHVTFLIFVAWIALSQGLLSGHVERALAGVGLLLSVFTCVLLHELGHAFAARRFGIRTRDIVLLPIGGVARLERMPEKPSQEIRVAVAGPLVNVAIASVLWLLRTFVIPRDVWDSIGPGALDTLLWINLVMIGFNLIPAFPMDGGRVLRAVLAMRMTYIRATRIATWIGQGLAIAFGIAGVFLEPHMLVLVGLFVFLAAGEEYAMVAARVTMGSFPVRAAMATSFATLEASDTLRHAVDVMRERDQRDVPVLDRGEVVGVLSRGPLVAALERHSPEAPVRDVLPPGVVVVADPLEALDLAFRRMLEARQGALPVMSDRQLVGIVTAENVAELMMEQGALQRARGARRTPEEDRLVPIAPMPPAEGEPPAAEREGR